MDYEKVSLADEQILENLLKEERYAFFADYEVKVVMFFKYGKRDKDGHLKKNAISKNGIPCAAQVRLISAFNRQTDNYDIKIVLDGDMWKDLSKDERIAIVDHELTHIQMVTDADGEPVMINENCDKVKLKCIRDDVQMWGFSEIIERYGKDSQELQCLQSLVNRYKHLLDV